MMNDYTKLDSLLHATPAPNLSAHDEVGQSLMGLATQVASVDGRPTPDVEGLRLLLAAGGRPRADDMGTEGGQTLIERLARGDGEQDRLVLDMLLNAGLSANTPTSDGRSVLLYKYLKPDAARAFLAHGADKTVRDARAEAADWSPVTVHAEMRNWATALALLQGGVPPDHGTPSGAVLARVLKDEADQLTDDDRADASFKTFMTLVQK